MSAINSNPAMQPSQAFQGPAGKGFGDLSSQQFTSIMMEALTNQDPLKPTDTSEILEQVASLRNIESQQNLQDKLEEIVLQSQLSEASAMIGRMVEGLNSNFNRVDGLVTSVRVSEGKAMLELDTGQTLPLDQVERVWVPDEHNEPKPESSDDPLPVAANDDDQPSDPSVEQAGSDDELMSLLAQL